MPFKLKLNIRLGALLTLIGFILSGPVAVAIVLNFAPQPTWESAAAFKENFSWLQTIPYFFGFYLVSGIVLLVYAHKNEYKGRSRGLDDALNLAFGAILIFAGLIIFNYICQTTFIPHMAKDTAGGNDDLISGFSMANPRSLSWSIEMWGYAILGKALWLLSGCYSKTNKVIPALLSTNLILSIASLVWSIINPEWVETSIGLILFMVWNALMMLIAWLIYLHARSNPASPEYTSL